MSLGSDEIVVGNKDGLYTYDNPAEIEKNDLVVLGDQHNDYKPCMWVTVREGEPGQFEFSSSGLFFWTEDLDDKRIMNNRYCRVLCATKYKNVNVDYSNNDLVFLSGSRPATPAGFYRENDDRDGWIISHFDGKGHYRYYDPLMRSFSEQVFDERSTPPEVADKKIVPLNVDFTEEDTK